jgi:hypothetical protein
VISASIRASSGHTLPSASRSSKRGWAPLGDDSSMLVGARVVAREEAVPCCRPKCSSASCRRLPKV